MILFKLAFKNLMGAGLRTWLNVLVLSFTFVVIIWHKGLLDGWNLQAKRDMIHWEVGGGQFWHPRYDPYDPLSFSESSGPIPLPLKAVTAQKKLAPILLTPGILYPQGRLQNVLMKGIDPDQTILDIPSCHLTPDESGITPIIIGERMAAMTKLKKGDEVTIQFKDRNGVYDALDLSVKEIFKTHVPAVDNGQIWISLPLLQTVLRSPSHATIIVTERDFKSPHMETEWPFKGHAELFKEFNALIRQKSIGGIIFYILLLMLAMITIFDTQVFSVFRRQKEIGTHMALGMTRFQVVGLFTIEGGLHSLLAVVAGALFGSPLLFLQARFGFSIPQSSDSYGLPAAERLFPVYSITLVGVTICLIILTTTIVSFLPAAKISKMKPTDAIRGRIS